MTDKIIKLKESKKGFEVDQAFIDELAKRIEKEGKGDDKIDIGLVVSESISIFLDKYQIKEDSNVII